MTTRNGRPFSSPPPKPGYYFIGRNNYALPQVEYFNPYVDDWDSTWMWTYANDNIRATEPRRLMGPAALVLAIICSISACASESPITGPLTAPLSPLMPLDAAVTAGVFIEDLHQTQEQDDQEASALELISDCLSMPWNLAVGSIAMVGGLVWSLTDYPEHTMKQRANTILEYLPYHHAAPAAYYDSKTRQTVRTP